MLSKSEVKRITRLGQKKYRKQEQLFVAEGIKVIQELVDAHFSLEALYTTDVTLFKVPSIEVSEASLKKVSFLKTPQKALALFYIPDATTLTSSGITVVLDNVRDPGNLGTIIRLCDWFGIEELICSHQTVDCYNPKVVQATMGSLSRVRIVYEDVKAFLEKESRPVFGTYMDGDSIYEQELPEQGVIVMGNEANGISPELASFVSKRVAIPRFGESQKTESLNVATATAVFLSEFRRGTTGR